MPFCMAVTNSASVQSPMPWVGSGEMLGAMKVPKSLTSASPARQDQAILALRLAHRVARGAATGPEHGLPGGGVTLKGGDLLRRHVGGRGQRIERAPGGKAKDDEEESKRRMRRLRPGRCRARPPSDHCSAW
jgi:hypothetical protein